MSLHVFVSLIEILRERDYRRAPKLREDGAGSEANPLIGCI